MAGILPFGAMFIELFFIFSVSLTAYSGLHTRPPSLLHSYCMQCFT